MLLRMIFRINPFISILISESRTSWYSNIVLRKVIRSKFFFLSQTCLANNIKYILITQTQSRLVWLVTISCLISLLISSPTRHVRVALVKSSCLIRRTFSCLFVSIPLLKDRSPMWKVLVLLARWCSVCILKRCVVHTLSHKDRAAGTLVWPGMVQWIFGLGVRRRNQPCF